MSQDHNHLNHAIWEWKCRVVFAPKNRKEALFGQIRRHLGTAFRELARRKECQIEQGHLLPSAYADIDPAEIFSSGSDRISEREELDLDCVGCGTQGAELSGPQILGRGLLRLDRRTE
jgi:hypothetical protein